jgi:hypothetical protein
MRSIKPGRAPSAMGGVGSIFGIIFGIFWTIMAFSLTRNAPFPINVFFPLFGVLFVIMGIIQAVYNFSNATGANRYSSFDITGEDEEPDPLNQAYSRAPHTPAAGPGKPARKHPGDFCPYCGARVAPDFDYCPKCGKDI